MYRKRFGKWIRKRAFWIFVLICFPLYCYFLDVLPPLSSIFSSFGSFISFLLSLIVSFISLSFGAFFILLALAYVLDGCYRVFSSIWNIIAEPIKKNRSKNPKCPHGVRDGLTKELCAVCMQEEEERAKIAEQRKNEYLEKLKQIEQEKLKSNILSKANELRDTEIERLRRVLSRVNEQALLSLSPREFEEIIADLYHELGYSVELTPYSDDYGIDVIAYKDGKKCVIQCKRYKKYNRFGRPVLQQFLGAMVDQKADKGIFVVTCYFTESAKEFAEKNNIELIDFDTLTSLMRSSLPSIDSDIRVKVMCLECGSVVEFPLREENQKKSCSNGHSVLNNIKMSDIESEATGG